MDEDNLPSLARYADGTGFLNSDNILSREANRNVVAEAVEGSKAMDERVDMSKSSCRTGDRERSPENVKKRSECDSDNLVSIRGKDKIARANSQSKIHSMFDRMKHARKEVEDGKKDLEEDEDELANCSEEPLIPSKGTNGSNATSDGMGRLRFGERLVKVSKTLEGQTSVPDRIISSSDDDRKPLSAFLPKKNQRTGMHNVANIGGNITQSKNKMNVHIDGGQRTRIMTNDVFKKEKKKREMQAFAISPVKKPNLGPIPEDVYDPMSNGSTRKTISLRETARKSIMKVKKEKREGKRRRRPTHTMKVIDEGLPMESSASEDVEDTSDEEDDVRRSAGESSGAEVKGDVDYKPSD